MNGINVTVVETPVEVTTDGSGEIVVSLNPITFTIETATSGPQGGAGAQGVTGIQGAIGTQGTGGLQGIQGPAGVTQVIAYTHIQGVSSDVWTINHSLGFYPNVTVVDSAGTIVEGEINYLTTNALVLNFSAAFSGNAYLS